MTRYEPSIHGSSHTEAGLSRFLVNVSGSGLHYLKTRGCVRVAGLLGPLPLGETSWWRPISWMGQHIIPSLYSSGPPALVSYFRTQGH